MKQHILPKQAKQLTEEEFYSLFDEIVPRKDWANYHHKKVTIGKLMEILRGYHQIDLYTVDEEWCIQLFEQDVCANDIGVSCIYEDSNKELVNVLFDSLLWVIENRNG